MCPCKSNPKYPAVSRQHRILPCAWVSIAIFLAGAAATYAAEAPSDAWSTYRGGNTRSSYLASDLTTDLKFIWEHVPRQAPRPAWPLPARGSYWQKLSKITARVDDDHAFQPVLAGGAVLFGSSADDSVYCLDATTGQVRWKLTTNGPVRYAPCVVGDRVFVGSDDGRIYCANLADGQVVWQRPLAPRDRLIPGNGRLISPWPVRTGVAVADGVIYVGVGLFPSQGVYVYALHADDGTTVWHQEVGYALQGYLLVSQDRLILPTGRSTPILMHRSDGQFVGQLPGTPGSYAVVTNRELLSGRGNEGELGATDIDVRQSLVSLRAQQICVTGRQSYLLDGEQLLAVELPRYLELSRQLNRQIAQREEQAELLEQLRKSPTAKPREIARTEALLQELKDKIDALHSQRKSCRLWQIATPCHGCLAAADNLLVLGGEGTVELRDRLDGHLLQQFPIQDNALGIALAEHHMVVTTEQGKLYCFSDPQLSPNDLATQEQSIEGEHTNSRNDKVSEQVARLVDENLLPAIGSTKGYALVIGAENPDLLDALCQQTELTILAIDDRRPVVQSLRQHFLRQGVYGSRVAVQWVEPGRLPFADYIANLVVSSRRIAGKRDDRWPVQELLRVLRPAGGVAWLDAQQTPVVRDKLNGAGEWVHQYGNTSNTAASGDRLVNWDLQLQWFGGPGPAGMVDRHLRAPAPLVANGRMLVGGENSMICVDSYHGTEYWQLDLPHSQRYSMPYDCGYWSLDGDRLAVAVEDSAWLIDARTGQVKEKIHVPATANLAEADWGYLALKDNRVYGSMQKSMASRTEPSRDQINRDYNNNRPTVTGTGLFLMDATSKELRWQYESIVLNPTIAISEDRVFFVASTDKSLQEHASGRIALQELLANGAEIVALESATGHVVWKKELDQHMAECRNILYLQIYDDRLILSGSYHRDNDTWYRIAVLDTASGNTVWEAEHAEGKPGAFAHGEQVHHPVVLEDHLVCEPAIYELKSGQRISPGGEPEAWTLTRPGHSCGTMSGAGNCLFFRSGNPTVMNLGPGLYGSDRFRKISASRPGCWINIIPADGLVLIPEASASCVCNYSLQTSLAFQPVPPTEE